MKITTFNANSIRARLDIILRWLDLNRPDILCIQETKVQDHDFPQTVFQEAGYHICFRGEKSYNGVAVASLLKPDRIRFGFDDDPADETRLLATWFGSLCVVNTYVPQGREIEHPMYSYKLQWLHRLKHWFETYSHPSDDLLWAGDMNVAPTYDDIHNAEKQEQHVCFHQDIRKAFAQTCEWGLHDVFRKHCPGKGHYTFFDYRTPNAVKRKMGWRIDHLLGTKSMLDRSVNAFIDIEPRLQPRPSDHTFLTAEFDYTLKNEST